MDTLSNIAKLTPKKRQKLIKEAYSVVNDRVKEKEEDIKYTSPLFDYWKLPEEERTDDYINDLCTKEERWIEGTIAIKKDPYYWETKYNLHMKELVSKDIASNMGIPNSLEKKFSAVDTVITGMGMLDVKGRREWLEKCIKKELFTPQTITRLKTRIYAKTDALKTDEGYKLTEVCIDNDASAVRKFLDEELVNNLYDDAKNIARHFCKNDLQKLKELIDIGDPFYVYRGFVIDGDERIRMGKRDDGADYWKQDAGSGISYSLNRDTAIYFAYWNLVNENGNTIPEVNESMKENRWWIHKLPPTIISFEEYATEMEWEIYRIRELEIMKGKKPILCKYLIDPETIRTFAMQTFESELMIEPSDVCLEKYSILTSKEMGIGVTKNRYQSLREWDDVTGLYNKDAVAMLQLDGNDGGVKMVFAYGKDVDNTIQDIKQRVKSGGSFKVEDHQKLVDVFINNSVELPIKDYQVNPINFTKEMYYLLTNKFNIDVKKRKGNIIEWSSYALRNMWKS